MADQNEETQEEVETTEATTEQEKSVEQVQEETQEQSTEETTEEDINLQEYWQERYQAPAQNRNTVNEVAQEMSQLPTDQSGNIDEDAAAQWLSKKFNDVQTAAERRAVERAEQIVMGNLNEVSQQQQLLEKYPDLKRDRETLDTVFDLRDAAALRGQNLSLSEAAAKLDKLRQQGEKSATSRTTIQAAAHLETASNKGSNAPQAVNLSDKASRQAMLRQFVEKGIESGEIQIPGR